MVFNLKFPVEYDYVGKVFELLSMCANFQVNQWHFSTQGSV